MENDITLWRKIKHAVARYLLADEVKRVDLERKSFLDMKGKYEGKIRELDEQTHQTIEGAKASLDVIDLVREQLKGFDPKMLDDDDDLPGILGEVEAQDAFLSKMKTLNDMPELKTVRKYLIRNQIIYTATEAENVEKQNFGRATINGLYLEEEEIARLATIYADRHKPEEGFDTFEVV